MHKIITIATLNPIIIILGGGGGGELMFSLIYILKYFKMRVISETVRIFHLYNLTNY